MTKYHLAYVLDEKYHNPTEKRPYYRYHGRFNHLDEAKAYAERLVGNDVNDRPDESTSYWKRMDWENTPMTYRMYTRRGVYYVTGYADQCEPPTEQFEPAVLETAEKDPIYLVDQREHTIFRVHTQTPEYLLAQQKNQTVDGWREWLRVIPTRQIVSNDELYPRYSFHATLRNAEQNRIGR